jgi:trehalose 6-phosphate synthase/phosphatase
VPIYVTGGTCRVLLVIVSHRLPLRASPDPAAPFEFAFFVDTGTVAYQLRSGLPANAPVLHIDTLPAAAVEAASDELSDYLLANFSCLPVYLPTDLHHRFYHGFCKHYLWPLLHYLLPLTSSSLGGLPFQQTLENPVNYQQQLKLENPVN